MPFFGSRRDARLVKSLSKEIINKIIDTPVLIYKLDLDSTSVNQYDESVASDKFYLPPVKLNCLIQADPESYINNEVGADVTQSAVFKFLKEYLKEEGFSPEVGDVIEYRSRFFEIDNINQNQLFAGKDPSSAFEGNSHGMDIAVICLAHMTMQNRLNLVENRFGSTLSMSDYKIPKGI